MLHKIWRWILGEPAIEGYTQEEMNRALDMVRFWRRETWRLDKELKAKK